jgi:hypothetical protein
MVAEKGTTAIRGVTNGSSSKSSKEVRKCSGSLE